MSSFGWIIVGVSFRCSKNQYICRYRFYNHIPMALLSCRSLFWSDDWQFWYCRASRAKTTGKITDKILQYYTSVVEDVIARLSHYYTIETCQATGGDRLYMTIDWGTCLMSQMYWVTLNRKADAIEIYQSKPQTTNTNVAVQKWTSTITPAWISDHIQVKCGIKLFTHSQT